MKRTKIQDFSAALRGTCVAAVVTLASVPAAFAEDTNAGLENFLAHPASFVAITDGKTGPVTSANMTDDTLAIQFVIPTHAGEMVGEYVGTVNVNGLFVGEGVLTPEFGETLAAEVIISFQDDGTIRADFDGEADVTGFMPTDMHYGY